jgi:hypothetical protein
VFFGDFGVLSYGPDGNERWRLPLGPFNNPNGHGSSPILADGKLVLICDQDTGSYLIAVDPTAGRVLWKTMRPEYTRGYATPAVYRPRSGPAELIVPGSFEVASYALETGEKLWWVRGMPWQLKSVPVIDRDRIFVNGWETDGDRQQRREIPEFPQILASYDKDHDGKLSRQVSASIHPCSHSILRVAVYSFREPSSRPARGLSFPPTWRQGSFRQDELRPWRVLCLVALFAGCCRGTQGLCGCTLL